jgi:hypothetical protein
MLMGMLTGMFTLASTWTGALIVTGITTAFGSMVT